MVNVGSTPGVQPARHLDRVTEVGAGVPNNDRQ
jgi:hypothetical protein